MSNELIGSLIVWLYAILGIIGIGLAKLIIVRRPDFAYILIGLWIVAITLVMSLEMNRSMTVFGSIGPGILAALAGLVFVWLGLCRLWPQPKKPLGFVSKNVLKLLLVGVVAGAISAGALGGVWSKSGHLPSFFWTLLISSNTVTKGIMEEAVFRGRIMQLLTRFTSSSEVVLLLQACLFAAAHLLGRIIINSTSGEHMDLAGSVSVSLLMGYVFGLLRVKTGSLWAPVSCHAVHNVLVYVAQLKG